MRLTFAEAAASQNQDLGTSDWFVVDQERIDAFAEATEDRQWIHVDPARAAQGPFGTTIAHGYLVLSLLPKLFAEIFEITDASMMINYGLDKVRFMHPVAVGSALRLRASLVGSTARGERLLLRVRGELEIREPGASDDDAKRAVLVETLFLAAPPVE